MSSLRKKLQQKANSWFCYRPVNLKDHGIRYVHYMTTVNQVMALDGYVGPHGYRRMIQADARLNRVKESMQ